MLSSVIQFVNYMDKKDIKYNNRGPLGDKGREVVEVSFSGKNMNSVRTVFYFDADAEGVAIRVYDIVKVPEEKVDVMYPAINSLNRHFRFAKFVLIPTTIPSRLRWIQLSVPVTWARFAMSC